MTPRRPSFTFAILAFVALTSLGLLAACGGSDGQEFVTESEASELAGYERTPEPTVASIALPPTNRDADEFVFMADPDELLLVAFGFTNCPDVCPTTLSDTRIALNILGDRAEEVDLAWVSVDPARDTADVVSNYVEAFVSDGIGLRTDDEVDLEIAAAAFGVSYFIEENDAGDIEVAHTPNMYVVDDTGSIILTWPFGVTSDDMANDLSILLDRAQQA